MVELRGCGSSGNNHKRGTDGTFVAVGGTVYNGNSVAAFLFCNEGGGTAAVKVNGGYAAGIKHDLRQLFHAAACGEGFLTAVKHHQYDFAFSGDTHASAGMTIFIISFGLLSNGYAVLDKERVSTDSFLDLIFISAVFVGTADHCRSVFKNGKEAFRTATVIFYALHNQCAGGSTIGHVVEVRVNSDNNIVVLNIVFSIGGIGMALLSCCHLIGYA